MRVPITRPGAKSGVERAEARSCVVVVRGTGRPVAPTLRALAAQDVSTVFQVVLAGPSAPEGSVDGGLRVRSAAGMIDSLAVALHSVREQGAAVVYLLRAGDEPAPAFLPGTLEMLRGDASLGCASSWIAVPGSEEKGWRPERLDGATLLAEGVAPPLAVRREALLLLEGGAPLEPGLEEWDLCLRLLERGVRAGVVREPLIARAESGPGDAEGAGHVAAVRRVLGRHAAFCRSQLVDAVVRSESRVLNLVRANFRLETLITVDLQPELQRSKLELQRLERCLSAVPRGAAERS